jgi:hypothetical protein
MDYPKVIQLNDNEIYVDFVFDIHNIENFIALEEMKTEVFRPDTELKKYGFRLKFCKKGKEFIEQFFTK